MSLPNDLRSILNDEKLCDVVLEGNDGENAPAAKVILASRTTYFRQMFYGEFVEASSDTVALDFPGMLLRYVVEFCHTGGIKDLERKVGDTKIAPDRVRLVVKIALACHYFGLYEVFCKDVFRTWFVRHIENNEENHHLACVLMEAISGTAFENESGHCGLRGLAADILVVHPTTSLFVDKNDPDSSGLLSLSATTLEKIMNDGFYINATELVLFGFIHKWVFALFDRSSDSYKENRLREGMHIARHIELTRILPSDLTNVVETSGLVEKDRLHEAYKVQARVLESKDGLPALKEIAAMTRENYPLGVSIRLDKSSLRAVNGIYKVHKVTRGEPFTVSSLIHFKKLISSSDNDNEKFDLDVIYNYRQFYLCRNGKKCYETAFVEDLFDASETSWDALENASELAALHPLPTITRVNV